MAVPSFAPPGLWDYIVAVYRGLVSAPRLAARASDSPPANLPSPPGLTPFASCLLPFAFCLLSIAVVFPLKLSAVRPVEPHAEHTHSLREGPRARAGRSAFALRAARVRAPRAGAE